MKVTRIWTEPAGGIAALMIAMSGGDVAEHGSVFLVVEDHPELGVTLTGTGYGPVTNYPTVGDALTDFIQEFGLGIDPDVPVHLSVPDGTGADVSTKLPAGHIVAIPADGDDASPEWLASARPGTLADAQPGEMVSLDLHEQYCAQYAEVTTTARALLIPADS